MKFGVFASNWEPFAYEPKLYEKISILAESLGYDFFLVSNHFQRPPIGSQRPSIRSESTIDTWTLLSYIAGKTSRIRIGSCVTPLPLYNPFLLSKIVASLDVLSDGRVILGVGAGYDQREFEVYGKWENASIRVERTREAIELIKQLWSNEIVDFKGKFYDAKQVISEPKPTQGSSLPIWTGAMGKKTLELTARLADVWIPSLPLGASLEFYEERSNKLRADTQKSGRKVEMGLVGHIVNEDTKLPFPVVGNLSSCIKTLESYKSFGCEYFAAVFLPTKDTLELMKKFHEQVVPSFA
jgi:alkanesulfonate monooxygenase SsuD/methylene tetrahydromethanopterin reductase-like flavin-dependent oxidoreductase (luciferase family)